MDFTEKHLNSVQANMLEGGGRTPILSPIDLEDIGYKIVAYPLSLMGVSIRAMQVTSSMMFNKGYSKRTYEIHKLKNCP